MLRKKGNPKRPNEDKHEFPYGGSYLGPSSRKLIVRADLTDFVGFFSYTGQRKQITVEHAN